MEVRPQFARGGLQSFQSISQVAFGKKAPRHIQFHSEQCHSLSYVIMQFAADAFPFLFLRLHQVLCQFLQMQLRVFHFRYVYRNSDKSRMILSWLAQQLSLPSFHRIEPSRANILNSVEKSPPDFRTSSRRLRKAVRSSGTTCESTLSNESLAGIRSSESRKIVRSSQESMSVFGSYSHAIEREDSNASVSMRLLRSSSSLAAFVSVTSSITQSSRGQFPAPAPEREMVILPQITEPF